MATDPQSEPNIEVTNPYTPRRPSPIISISVNHPLAAAARKIKNFLIHKQTLFSTSFSIKVTPIVALVSFFGVAALFGGGISTAFTFGKSVEQQVLAALPSPTPKVIVQQQTVVILSRSGTIKATYQLTPLTTNTPTPTSIPTNTPAPTLFSPSQTTVSILPNSLPTGTPVPTPTLFLTPTPQVLHYILVSRNGSITFLNGAPNVHFQSYLNLRVLITGGFDSKQNTLNITKPGDIEILQ